MKILIGPEPIMINRNERLQIFFQLQFLPHFILICGNQEFYNAKFKKKFF